MGEQPRRIQRKRTAGWQMPEGAVYVGRPTRWGNPFRLQAGDDPKLIVERYRFWLKNTLTILACPPQPNEIAQLRGKDLACWCPLDQPCHADVLLELANPPAGGTRERGTQG